MARTEFNIIHSPIHPSAEGYFWETGLIIDFDTPEGEAYRVAEANDYIGDIKNEFLVVNISHEPSIKGAQFFATVKKFQDGYVTDGDRGINFAIPSKLSESANWLRKINSYIVKIPNAELVSAE